MNIANILEMATLPAQIRNATTMGDVESSIIGTVAEQLKDSFKQQSKTVGIKEQRELLALYKDECVAFDEKPSREGYAKWTTDRQ